jgi:putative endonuclease
VKTFYVYMMTNQSRVVLYTEITNSLEVRVWQHRKPAIDGFTKKYHVDRLVYYESFNDPRDAISREKEIKGWRRSKKSELVERLNPKWTDLSTILFEESRSPSRSLGMTSKTAARRENGHPERSEGPHEVTNDVPFSSANAQRASDA